MYKYKKKSVHSLLVGTLLVGLAACSSGIQTLPGAQESEVTPQADSTAWQRIAIATDDAEETLSTGAVVLDSIDLDLGSNASGSTAVGVRFTGLGIPKGAVVKSANLYFLPKADSSGSATMSIQMHSSYTSNTFKTTNKDITSRSLTSTPVSWTVPTWKTTMTLQSAEVKSPNLNSLVQPLINGGAVDSLTFAIKGSGSRVAESFEGAAGKKPALEITYSAPPVFVPTYETCLDDSPSTTPYVTNGGSSVKLGPNSSGLRVNAKGKTFYGTLNGAKDKALNPLSIAKVGSFFCLSGGTVQTDLRDDSPWDSRKDYQNLKDPVYFHGGTNGSYITYTQNPTIERVLMKTVGDGATFKWGEAAWSDASKGEKTSWVFRNSYIRHAGDDAIENDWKYSGIIDNVLVDWAYTGISCRAGTANPDVRPQSPAGTITVRNSLIALKRQENTYQDTKKSSPVPNQAPPSHAYLFKADKASENPCKYALHNNVFYFQDNVVLGPSNLSDLIKSCSNNIIVAPDALNYQIPNSLKSCFSLAKATNGAAITTKSGRETFWKEERGKWFDRHPDTLIPGIQNYRNNEPPGVPVK